MANSEAKKAANRAYAKRRYAKLHGRESTETGDTEKSKASEKSSVRTIRETSVVSETAPRILVLRPALTESAAPRVIDPKERPKERRLLCGMFFAGQ